MKKVTFLGLGVMGYPMAGHLVKHMAKKFPGCKIAVYNRTITRAQSWQEQYGSQSQNGEVEAKVEVHESIAAAVDQAELVLCCLGNDDDVRQVLAQALPAMKKGAILADHTTTSAELAEDLAQQCHEQGLQFLDAPVSGGQSGAENGCLTIMCGAKPQLFQQLNDNVFPAYAKSAVYMGTHGQGQRAKMVNQICIAGVLRGLSEGLLLAQKAGLDVATLVSCLKNGAAGSWQMENRAESMAQNHYNFGFALKWMIKDLDYALHEAQRCGLQLPHTQHSLEQYRQLAAAGHLSEDSSALYRAVQKEQKG